MKAWSTKYALSTGIQEVEGEIADNINVAMFTVKGQNGSMDYNLHGEGVEWHRTEEAALKRALVLVEKKAASIRKSLKKLDMSETGFRNRLETLRSKGTKHE